MSEFLRKLQRMFCMTPPSVDERIARVYAIEAAWTPEERQLRNRNRVALQAGDILTYLLTDLELHDRYPDQPMRREYQLRQETYYSVLRAKIGYCWYTAHPHTAELPPCQL